MPRGGFGSELQHYAVFDFRGGVDLKTSALQLAVKKGQNALRKARNCVYTTSGGVTKRYDQTKFTWSALNNEEDYTTATNAGSAIISANDGGTLMDLVPSVNELILIKSNRPY